MVNLPLKPDGRTLAYFGLLKPAEQKLLDACRKGEPADVSGQKRQLTETIENTVRASFLRFLALGGDEHTPVHDKGVQLFGAWVDGELDLEGATLPHSLMLMYCHLTHIILRHSIIYGCVGFQGCLVNGLSADGMECSGGVFMEGFTSTGAVNLLNARIGGNLECRGGKFDVENADALICDRAVIQGSVFLNDFEKGSDNVRFTAAGLVSFAAARIDGSLDCSNAVFNGTRAGEKYVALACDRAVIKGSVFLRKGFIATGSVRLSGAQIGGNLEFVKATLDGGMDDYALQAEGVTVVGAFHFNNMRSIEGIVSLSSAKVGGLIDDNQSWTMGELILDGFIYDKLSGNTFTDAETRLKWLDKQLPSHAGLEVAGNDFKPQPWQQLQKVLREMGHLEDARQVAIAFEDRLRKAKLIKHWILHWLFGLLIGYGYRPFRLFIITLMIWLSCGVFYSYAAYQGVFAPSNPLVFQNPEFDACKADKDAAKFESDKLQCSLSSAQGAGNWYLCSELREEYTGFSPFAYSLDLILPLVDLQQEHDWAPRIPTPKNTWTDELLTWDFPKHCTRFLMWFEILFGWISSLLLVAVVSGLTKRREE